VIPRWQDDRYFPEFIWGSVQRLGSEMPPAISNRELAAALSLALNSAEK